MCTPCQSDRYARQLVKQPSYQRMVRRIFQREGAAAGAKRGRGKRRSFPPRRGKGEGRRERERDGPVAVGAIRCLEPRVVGNHLLGVKNSKLRVDMGLCLHRLQPTTGLRGTDVPVIPVALSLYIYIYFSLFPRCSRINCSRVRVRKGEKRREERKKKRKRGGRPSKRFIVGTRGIRNRIYIRVYICVYILYMYIHIYV